ncbi:MAG: hypothetical protein K5649_01005 [Lachnospiraceae bacterium]|nr:hypothetical protein [Lachnospiraceae bacterium]
MKKLFKEQENRIAAFVFVVVLLVVCSPLITKLCINGHDLEYHLLRIESLKEGILMGRPFAKINVLFFGGAGYASSLFYPDFLLYIPGVLRALGVSINKSYHIFVAICILLTYCSTNYCVKKMTQSVYAGLMAAILTVSSPYYLGDIYVRGAVGEFTAFIFLPFVIYGIYNVLYEGMDKTFVLALGYAGVLLCHTNTFVFCLFFGALAFLIKWKRFRDNLPTLWKLLITASVTALLTMFYWLPMLEMYLSTPLYVNTAWIKLEQTAGQLFSVLSNQFPSIGFLLVILAFFRALVKKNPQNRDLIGFADWLLIGGAAFSILATDLIPWQRLNGYLDFVQFPWRLFMPATAMLAVADAIILSVFIKSSLEPYMPSSTKVLSVVLLVVAMAFAIRTIGDADITYYDYSDDYYTYKPYTGNVIAGEWLPETVTDRDALIEESEHLYADNGDDLAFERIKDRVEADIQGNYQYVDVPFIYYKGYRAELATTDKTVSLPVDSGQNGLCRVNTQGQQGRLIVYYGGTVLQLISLLISILTAVFLIVFRIYGKKKAKAALLLFLLCICGCRAESSGKSDIVPIPDISAEGLMKAEGAILENENTESEPYRLLFSKEGYTGFDLKPVFLQCPDCAADLTVTASLCQNDTERMQETLEISRETAKYPVLLCDLSGISETGRYLFRARIVPENGTAFSLEEEITVADDKYDRIYTEMLAQAQPSVSVYACADHILAYELTGDEKLARFADSARDQLMETLETYYHASSDETVRFFTTAWLYKETGDKQYRKEAEAYLDTLPETAENVMDPALLWGLAAYLRTTHPVDYRLSEKAMGFVFSGANSLLKRDQKAEWERLYEAGTDARMEEALQNAQLLILANYVSNSAEYVRCAGNYLAIADNRTDSLFVVSGLDNVPL